jgi:hypothetical protein
VCSANLSVVSPRAPLRLRAVSCLVVLASLAPWRSLWAEPASTAPKQSRSAEIAALREWSETTTRLQASIDREQSENGPRSRALIDLYMTLGLAHQEHGEQGRAAEAFQHALEVKRANDGLYNLEQAPMLGRLQASQAASGNLAAAGLLEKTLLRLASANPLDPRSVQIWREFGDRQLAAYERYLAGDRPPPALEVHVGVAMGPGAAPAAVPSGGGGSLWMARGSYSQAIRNILRRGEYGNEELPELEHELIRTYYLEAERIRDGGNGNPAMLFARGEQGYERLAAYIDLNGGTALEQARALVDLADWHLLFSHNGEAIERYDAAYQILLDARTPEAVIRQIFPTDRPVLLPAFQPSPFESDGSLAGDRYVDLKFEVSKYGVSRRVRVSGSSGSGDAVEKDAVSIVARNRFRPQPTASDAHEAIYRVRYHAAP